MANAERESGLSSVSTCGPVARLGLAIAALAFAFDQATKFWLLKVIDLPARQSVMLTPFFELKMEWNAGVSYGLLKTHMQYVLIMVSLIISAILLRWLWRVNSPFVAAALGLIIGGALSNALDRAIHGAVADFFYIHFDWLKFSLLNFVFNLADVAIVAGVALLLYNSTFHRQAD